MMLFGWCTKCRKLKPVNVQVPATKGIQIGICRDCGVRA